MDYPSGIKYTTKRIFCIPYYTVDHAWTGHKVYTLYKQCKLIAMRQR